VGDLVHHQPLGLRIVEWVLALLELAIVAGVALLGLRALRQWRRDGIAISDGVRSSPLNPAATALVAILVLLACAAALQKVL